MKKGCATIIFSELIKNGLVLLVSRTYLTNMQKPVMNNFVLKDS